MDSRHIALVALWLPYLFVAGCSPTDSGATETSQLVRVLSGVSEEEVFSSKPVIVTWVFRTEDCLTCQAFPAEIRRALKEHGESIRFAAIQVGAPGDTTVAKAFFERERLNPRYVQVRSNDYRATFGDLPLPAIYVIVNGRLVRAEFGDHAGAIRDSRLSQFIEMSI